MKSLEIVNEKIVEAIYPRYTYTETIWDEEVIINKNELETIKQDLEVLEIIINKKINIENIKTKLECWGNLEALLDMWNSLTSHKDSQLTMEELLKLKQWLENNKVGDSND